ncbi:hypothetical protein A2U01_0064464 [Trifolium medium]|uniref:Uncharacterized protein n=1 Tax=Trifolium medium TaxID=97028 RepID=A0A392S4C0_9FABA|nr:hypothetical protein [Trifolium medium]
MNSYPVEMNSNLDVVYYNKGKLNLFRIKVDVTLYNLKHQLNGHLNYGDTMTEASVEYLLPSVDSDERVRFTNMKLQYVNDLITMFSIFS